MIIEYVWSAEPEKKKRYDTKFVFEKVLRKRSFGFSSIESYDEFTLKKFEEDKKAGRVLEYKIISK